MPADDDVLAQQAAASLSHGRVRLGQDLVQNLLRRLLQFLLELGDSHRHQLTLVGVRRPLLLLADLLDLARRTLDPFPDNGPELLRLSLELLLAKIREALLVAMDLVDDRLDLPNVAFELGAQEIRYSLLDHPLIF